jgi:hypothetical protein
MKNSGLKKGEIIGGWKIDKIYIDHIVLETYRKYEFPIDVVVIKSGTQSSKNALGE